MADETPVPPVTIPTPPLLGDWHSWLRWLLGVAVTLGGWWLTQQHTDSKIDEVKPLVQHQIQSLPVAPCTCTGDCCHPKK